jgi:hypothetical protein
MLGSLRSQMMMASQTFERLTYFRGPAEVRDAGVRFVRRANDRR